MKDLPTPEEIALKHFSCTCDDVYKSRNLPDPDCAPHYYGTEICNAIKEGMILSRDKTLEVAAEKAEKEYYTWVSGFLMKNSILNLKEHKDLQI